jgi:hypothetical protein
MNYLWSVVASPFPDWFVMPSKHEQDQEKRLLVAETDFERELNHG